MEAAQANGSLHMGHALNKILKDIINKFKAMQGYKAGFPSVCDVAGWPASWPVRQSIPV